MMARTVAEKYWLSGIARKESRFLSTGLRTAATSRSRQTAFAAFSLLLAYISFLILTTML